MKRRFEDLLELILNEPGWIKASLGIEITVNPLRKTIGIGQEEL